MPSLGTYSKEIVLAKIDMRSKEGRLLKQVKTKLLQQLGHQATASQYALIERIAWLALRCATLDKKIADGTFTNFDSNVYLAWNNSLRRNLIAFGFEKGFWGGKALGFGDVDDAA
jgi:hypothetical protein